MDLYMMQKSKLWKLYKNLRAYVILHYQKKPSFSATEVIEDKTTQINLNLEYKTDKTIIARECYKMLGLFLDKGIVGKINALDIEIDYLREVYTALEKIADVAIVIENMPNYIKEQYPIFLAMEKEKIDNDIKRIRQQLNVLFDEKRRLLRLLKEQREKLINTFLDY